MKENEKFCDECGKNPAKVFVQLEARFKLICSNCLGKENRHTHVEQWVDYDDADIAEAF